MKTTLFVMIGLALSLSFTDVEAGDAKRGKELHDASCLTSCHSSRVDGPSNALYTRKGRRDSLEKLTAQVNFCNQQVLDSEWWPEDVADVVEYLNKEFYHFK